ncbi:MAG: MATE family efflux transporter [Lachnospiraceae bacterium]|nr:MATE family efflux transporter [Lachnospiraceae bacterium]
MKSIGKMPQQEKVAYMQSERIPVLVGKLSVPTIISMLITALYNMADTFFVGKINTQATAAVGLVFSVMAIIQALGFYYGHGSGNYISRKLGAGEFDAAADMASTGFVYAFATGIVVSAVGLVFLKPIAILLGSTETIFPYTVDYLRIILIGAPFTMSSFVVNNQLRFQGSATYAMVGICSGAILNIGLDPLFIFAFKLGVAGAALSTVVSQITSLVILLFMTRKGGNLRVSLKGVHFGWYYMAEIFKGGFPSLVRQALGSISTIFLNRAAGTYGAPVSDAAIAAMSVVGRYQMFCYSALIGFGQGFQPVCGMNYGGKKYDRVREAFWFCVRIAFFVLLAIAVVSFIFSEQIITFFRKDDLDVIRIGTVALRYQIVVFPLASIVVLSNMMLQSVGKTFRASVLSGARQGLFLIPAVFVLPYFLGLRGVQMAQMVADICSFILTLPMVFGFLNEMKKESDLYEQAWNK